MKGIEYMESSSAESREGVPRVLRVFRVRHGETDYKEHTNQGDETVDFDLTKEGRASIVQAAEAIAGELDPERDIVLLATSTRKRTRDSAELIRNYLSEKGFDVRFDDDRSVRDWLQGSDLLDDENVVVPPGTPEHASIFARLSAMPDLHAKHQRGELSGFEKADAVQGRSRNHLALLTRFARRVQFPEGKNIVVVETEHEETLDELVRTATDGERGMATGTGPAKGEVLELTIPREGEDGQRTVPMGVRSLSEDLARALNTTIEFDYLKREFVTPQTDQ
jgi:broad specificity phosphatase PhoE